MKVPRIKKTLELELQTQSPSQTKGKRKSTASDKYDPPPLKIREIDSKEQRVSRKTRLKRGGENTSVDKTDFDKTDYNEDEVPKKLSEQ